jgi:NTE family protein
MAETDHNYSPLAPAISPLPPDERRRARAAESSPHLGGSQLPATANRIRAATRPRPPFECIALLLQGGGALGAYQAGVYEALTKADLDPDWIAGVSIGAINGALIAGNSPENRVDRLRAFWERVTAKPYCDWSERLFPAKGDAARQWLNQVSDNIALIGGAPGFFTPRLLAPWLYPPGTIAASGHQRLRYQLSQGDARGTDRFRSPRRRHHSFQHQRCQCEDRQLRLFRYQDPHDRPGAHHGERGLAAGFPAIEIEGEHYWDGGLVSNTPLASLT